MAHELIYTSAARGIRPGTRGFCTVAYTKGMRLEAVRYLEALSAYRELYPVHDRRAGLNPISYSHYRCRIHARNLCILSRVAPASADHTHRSNKVAHHVILDNDELCPAGPARLCAQEEFFIESWDSSPHIIEKPKPIEDLDPGDTFAGHWEEVTGDAGWAGALAYSAHRKPDLPAFIVFEPGTDLLTLIKEAVALLPPEKRWQITYNTYFSSLPAGTVCQWRCCVPDSPALKEARRNPRTLVIDLTGPLESPRENPLVICAREGGAIPSLKGGRGSTGKRAFSRMPGHSRRRIDMKPGPRRRY